MLLVLLPETALTLVKECPIRTNLLTSSVGFVGVGKRYEWKISSYYTQILLYFGIFTYEPLNITVVSNGGRELFLLMA